MLLLKDSDIKFMRTRQKGFYRNKEIVYFLKEYFKILTTEQIYVLFFSNIKNYEQGINKTREVMRKLRKDKKLNLKWARQDFNEPNYYYFEKKHNPDHEINRNWGFIYLLNKFKSYHKFNDLRTEYVLGLLQADGFIELRNFVTDKLLCFFIESDIANSKNQFKKIKKYTEMHMNRIYKREKWSLEVENFPDILVICDTEKRVDKVKEYVKRDNKRVDGKPELIFEVIGVDQIKKELLK
jgi:hypothetical protein